MSVVELRIRLLLFTLSAVLIIVVVSSVKVYASSNWLEGWHYRVPIIVQSVESLKDYQLRITVNTAALIKLGKLKPDCSDLRFTLSDGVTQLPYWIEEAWDAAHRYMDPVPQLKKGDTVLYMYYGNPDAAPAESTPKQIFLYYVDSDEDFKPVKTVDVYAPGNYIDVEVLNGILIMTVEAQNDRGVALLVPLPGDNYTVEAKALIATPWINNSQAGIYLWNGQPQLSEGLPLPVHTLP